MGNDLAVAFCINKAMFGAFRVALGSFLRSNCGWKIFVFHEDLDPSDIEKAEIEEAKGELKFIRFSLDEFRLYRSLHGDFTTYGKFLISELIDHDVEWCLYVDADVIVNIALQPILMKALEENRDRWPFMAVCGGVVNTSLDRDLYLAAGLQENSRVFNAGVMFFNTRSLRENRLLENAHIIGRAYGEFLRSADQPIFNILYSNCFVELPEILNRECYPNERKIDFLRNDEGIFHFVGSPKPWDFMGWIHQSFGFYNEFARSLGISMQEIREPTFYKRLMRTFSISRSIYRLMKCRFKELFSSAIH